MKDTLGEAHKVRVNFEDLPDDHPPRITYVNGKERTDDVLYLFGDQEAVEDKQRQLGRFTYRLVEALNGAADQSEQGGDANGVVTWKETVAYVTAAVTADSARDPDGSRQFPTAGPLELLDYARLPLTGAASPQVGGG